MATLERAARRAVPGFLRSPSMPTLLIISALAIGAAAVVPLVQSSIATSTNDKVRRLEQQRADWQARIQELELDVAGMASLQRIDKEAREGLKMVEPRETRYITVPVAAPEPRRLPSQRQPTASEDSKPDDGIWERLLGWLSLP